MAGISCVYRPPSIRWPGEFIQDPLQEEADAEAVPYSPWRQVHPGEWALTDDGFVCVCLCLQEFKERNGRIRRLFTFPLGRIWDSRKVRLDFMERHEVGNWSATSAKSWLEIEAKRSRTKTAVSLYVRQVLTNGKPDYEALGKVYRPDQRIPAATFRRLLSHHPCSPHRYRITVSWFNGVLPSHGVETNPSKLSRCQKSSVGLRWDSKLLSFAILTSV